MALPASGALSLDDIQTEFGGSNPIGIDEYYAGGAFVPPGTSGTNGPVPSSGTISINNFFGTSLPVFKLYAWGRNQNGQLGLNDTVNRLSPVQVGALLNWSQSSVSNSGYFCAAVKTDNTLWSWGAGNYGRLGLNSNVYRSSPVQIGALTDWARVSAEGKMCAAVKTNGTIWTWGKNNNGQLGHTFKTYLSSPTQVGALTGWSQISTGGYFCAAIKTNGTLWTWGTNGAGELGHSNRTNLSSPIQVGSLTNWSKIAISTTYFCVAVKTDGSLWTWGNGAYGRLGLNQSGFDESSPVQVGALTDWAEVAAGNSFCMAIKTNGTLWSWGRNSQGQLGLNNRTNFSSPVQIGALTNWTKVAAEYACAAIKTDGTLWTWGSNAYGQLGNGNTNTRSSPTQVGALTTWTDVDISNFAVAVG